MIRDLFRYNTLKLFCFFTMLVFAMPLSASAATHDFSLTAFDWDVTANDWEGEGTEDQIENGGYLEPGQVFKVDINYVPGSPTVVSMQIGIKYDPSVLEVIHDSGELYIENDMSTTYQGGIWPAVGTSAANKKKTNWTVDYNDDAEVSMIKLLIYDSQDKSPLENEGVLSSVYFKVKDDAPAGSTVKLDFDSSYTKVVGNHSKTLSGLEFVVFGQMSSDVSLDTLTLIGSNGLSYLLNPLFTSGTSERIFNTVVPNNVSSVTINATPKDETAKVLPGGLGNKNLSVGDNSFNVVVQSQNGTQEIYQINIKRLSNDATLKTLNLTGINLDYALSNSVFTYTGTVPYATTATTVSAETTHADATIKSGTGAWNLTNYGTTLNTKTITVEAEDCKTTYSSVPGNSCTSQNYTLNITRTAPSSDNTLSDLKVDGQTVTGFNPNQTEYILPDVANSKTSINITAATSDSKATVTGTGNKTLNFGDNTFVVTVTAEDKTTKTYEIKVRRLSNNANLATLSVTSTPQGVLSPSFNPTFYNYYTYTYDSTVTDINIAATLEDSANATIVSGTGSYSSSDTEANIVVQAEDGTLKTYVVKFSRNKSSDNNLKSLSIDGYNLNETFSPTKTLYTATVPGTVSEININAVVNDPNATIVSGTGKHTLDYGTNIIQIRVQAENGTEKDYTITVTRNKKDISALSDLKVNNTTVTGFREDLLAYNIGTVPFETTSINISATPKDSDATVTGTGIVNLNTGSNTIKVTVTAQDGVSKTEYTITVNREKSSNTNLSSLTLQEKAFTFNKTTKIYNVEVDNEVVAATINAVPEYSGATATISGPSFLSVGLNTYTITVTAENGDIGTYTLNITRKASTNDKLSALTVTNQGTNYLTSFNANTETYNITVPNEVSNVDINAVLADSITQTVTGTGNKTLSTGLNTFPITVTAASGNQKTYTINITRALNANNKLQSLEVVDQTLSPAFNKNTNSYNVTVESYVSNIVINATPEVSSSTVTGTGTKTLQTGTNTFNVEVTSEDNQTNTYVIVVTKKASNDSTLSSLSINETNLNETFQRDLTVYTANVPNNVSQVTINATASDDKAKGVTGIGVVKLNTGSNTVRITVTAEDNTTTTYTVVITRAKSTNANLKNLTLSDGYNLNETFNKDTINYTANVPNNVSTVTINAEPEETTSTVAGTGPVTLNTGNNTVKVVVTSEDGSVTKTYTIDIFRELSSNNDLKSLTSTNGTISPAFNKTIKDYTLTVPYEVENATINAIAEEENAKVTITGNTNLAMGTNNVTITVMAENGDINIYNLVITRQPSSNNFLSSLEVLDINGQNYITVFNKTTLTYKFSVAKDINQVEIKATAEDKDTTIEGLGTKTLQTGTNTFTVKSISATGTAREYVIEIEKAKDNNANLKSLSIDSQTLVPDFSPETLSYSLSVGNDVSSIKINAAAESDTATVEGDGQHELSTGLNTFNINVTAQDGTKKTYIVVVNKAASSNNSLASLLADQPFAPTFDKNTLNYTSTVANNIDNINIQAIAEDPNATVTGNGDHPLVIGDNQIEITVTAEDNTFRMYTIHVYREPSDNNFLSDLKVNGNTVTGFDRSVTEYTMTVENEVVEANITATAEDSTATVQGTGTKYLVTGDNTINVTVTAQSGNIKTYTITINRKKSSNNNLALLNTLEGTLSPTFSPDQTSYTMQVPYEITSLNLQTVAEDANATIEIEGNKDFQVGNSNIVYITVIAEDKTTKTYQIEVNRMPQANNYLNSLTIKTPSGKEYPLSPTFNKNTLSYNISINAEDSRLNVSGTKEAESSTVTGFGDIDVNAFPYIHQVTVTSAGGVDRTYTITINKNKSTNTNLKGITTSEGILSPAFDPAVTDYTIKVGSNVGSINIDAILDEGQTVAGTGTHNLNYGENNIPIVVTAEDGGTKTYNVTVIRDEDISADLSNISVTNGTLSPVFKSEVLDYIAYIGTDATSITITPTVSDILAQMSISVNGAEYQSVNNTTITDLESENIIKIRVKGTNETKIYTVTLMKQSTEKITSHEYGHDISDGMIKTVAIDTSAETMKDQLDNDNEKLKIYQSDGVTEYTGKNIGTGMIVKLFQNDLVIDQKVIVVKGDTDGNGLINAIDALKVVNHIIENELLSGCYLVAAETTNDTEINAIDALKIVNHIIGNASLY